MTNWATGHACQWCGILWAVVRVAYKVRAVGSQERHTFLCRHDCLRRAEAKALPAVEKPYDAFYEYVNEVPA